MSAVVSVVFWLLMFFAASQVWFGFRIGRVLRWGRRRHQEGFCPKAAVILCVRGPDPFLAATLEGLLRQEYPDYQLHIVVDHPDDPAWAILNDVLARHPGAKLRAASLVERRETCSLKCSSLVQAVSGLDPSCQIVALVDADAVPHPGWLSELAEPLADPRVGVATGNRWYMPSEATWGAIVRYLWNAGAVIAMFLHKIPWGGAVALKAELLRQSDLLDRWAHAFCEDTMLTRLLKARGLSVRFVPGAVMINRETCDLPGCVRWILRQCLTARLYHPGFLAAAVYGVACAATLVAATLLLGVGLVSGRFEVAAWLGGGLIGYGGVQLSVLTDLEGAVRRIVAARGQPVHWLSPSAVVKLTLAIPITQIIHACCLIGAYLVRKVQWRGVVYAIGGPWRIRLLQYRPYLVDRGQKGNQKSL